ncbi:N-acyl homoserine lactonase family protein [Halobaculum sp. CBA1158]|uniref:N-acyl homoserine lactonase family protein n=1 Tax=Halobaculum sp. CBA1158 TaxID=2904243 RepID=UPI001F224451|nr:N-acyl homoserine lactonase family protein [Halobaculum sp. CBA1158]UIO98708.1 N-acyl homoserine lactonase family protein [Halobaculum sp. CBA1158]
MPKVTLVDRGRVRADRGYVIDGASMASANDPSPEHERIEFVVWNAVIEAGGTTYLWDTGVPSDAADAWPAPLYGAFEAYDADDHSLEGDLEAAGYDIADVDAVVMSHLHLDHAGNLDAFAGTGTPVYVHREELGFAFLSAHTDEGSIAYLASDFDGDLNWNVINRHRHTLADGFELLHLPGHTPGLLGARVDTDDGTLLIAGDECYVDANYAEGAPLGPGLLWSEPDWRESLETLREIQRRTDAEVLYGHDLDRFERLADRY